ncbi:MAG: hypothetical protein HY686_05095 [Chloroflexi bacterium]|nr:hypothetical protein [Chloroflexota bacterium]
MVQAGSMGVPFVPVRGLLGSDLLRHRTDFKVTGNPFNPGEELVLAPAINPEVALFHAVLADRQGNFITPGKRDDLMVAQSSRRVIVTAEQVADRPITHRDGDGVFVPAIYTTAVVLAPHGAHPAGVRGLYPPDLAHVREYAEAARSDATFQAYLRRYVSTTSDEAQYQERVGLASTRR